MRDCDNAAAESGGGKPVLGRYHENDHGSKNQESGQREQQLLCRCKSARPQTHPPISLASLASVEKWAGSSWVKKKVGNHGMNSWRRRVTHTRTLTLPEGGQVIEASSGNNSGVGEELAWRPSNIWIAVY